MTTTTNEPARPDLLLYGKHAGNGGKYVAGQIELTTACSQRCGWCQSWRQPADEWKLEDLKIFCLHLAEAFRGFEHLTLTGGDPLSWPWLYEFLDWFTWQQRVGRIQYHLQITTALAKTLTDAQVLLLRKVRDIRVSLDAMNPATYQKIRGVRADPEVIVARLHALKHPRASTLTTVGPENVREIPAIIEALQVLHQDGYFRRAIFLPVIGVKVLLHEAANFNADWRAAASMDYGKMPTSFAEDPWAVRAWCQSEAAHRVPCYASRISFHVKASGEVYPCCLVGGEAIETCAEMRLGNVRIDPLINIWRRASALSLRGYANPGAPCRDVCQFKQAALNAAGHKAAETILSVP